MGDPNDPGSLLMVEKKGLPLFVFFGGIGAIDPEHSIPTFEFKRFFEDLEGFHANALFLVDHYDAWYHRGVKGLSNNLSGVADWINSTIDILRPPRVIMMGASAGGTAAIYFGLKLVADSIHAFGPQTNLTREFRASIGEDRWEPEIQALQEVPPREVMYDVALYAKVRPSAAINLWYAEGDHRDKLYCDEMLTAPNVTVTAVTGEDHNCVRILRDNGGLEGIVRAEVPFL